MEDNTGFNIVKLWVYIFIGGLLIAGLFLGWELLLGPAFNRADYNNFNTSPQHANAVAQKFADDCQQIAMATTPLEVKAIENDIYSLASTVDLNTIQMPTSVRTCVNKAINDVNSSGGQ